MEILIVRNETLPWGQSILKSRSRSTASENERERRSTRSRGKPSFPRMGATDTASQFDVMNGTKHAYNLKGMENNFKWYISATKVVF